MASRKDYVALAESIRDAVEHTPTGGTLRERSAWRGGFFDAVDLIAELFAHDNPRFDAHRFYAAAAIVNVPPAVLQAAVWIAIRGRAD